MKVIIVDGSKHVSTRAIAETVGDEMRKGGLGVSIADANAADVTLDGYDAAVIGSAVNIGRWTKDARAFVAANHESHRCIDAVEVASIRIDWLQACFVA